MSFLSKAIRFAGNSLLAAILIMFGQQSTLDRLERRSSGDEKDLIFVGLIISVLVNAVVAGLCSALVIHLLFNSDNPSASAYGGALIGAWFGARMRQNTILFMTFFSLLGAAVSVLTATTVMNLF